MHTALLYTTVMHVGKRTFMEVDTPIQYVFSHKAEHVMAKAVKPEALAPLGTEDSLNSAVEAFIQRCGVVTVVVDNISTTDCPHVCTQGVVGTQWFYNS